MTIVSHLSSIVGMPKDNCWSHAYSSKISDDEYLIITISLRATDDDVLVDLTALGMKIVEDVIELAGEARLETIETLKSLITRATEGVGVGISTSMAMGVIRQDGIVFAAIGEVGAILIRNNKMVQLIGRSKTVLGIKGVLLQKDKIVLGTEEFVQVSIGKSKQNGFENENLSMEVRNLPDSSGTAGVLINVEENKSSEHPLHGKAGSFVQGSEAKESWWTRIKSKREYLYVKREKEPGKYMIWGLILLVILVISIVIGAWQRGKVLREDAYKRTEEQVTQATKEARGMFDLNPEMARNTLARARQVAEQYVLGQNSPYKERGQKLVLLIEEAEKEVFNEKSVDLTTLIELSVINPDFLATKMRLEAKEKNLLLYDLSSEKIVGINVIDRSQIVYGEKLGEYLSFVNGEKKLYGLKNDGVYEFSKKGEASIKKVIEADENWIEPKILQTFGGNIYVLDVAQGEIWKYPVIDSGFGARKRWFGAGIVLDLSKVVDMKVGGDVWLLTSTGKLEKYSRGAPAEFTMEGFVGQTGKLFVDPVALYLTEDRVFVAERGEQRIVVFGIDGRYQKQYQNAEFGKASDLVVEGDKGYVLVDDVIKMFSL